MSSDDSRPPGRPRSVMTPETVALILRSVRAGLHLETAARVAGIPESTARSMAERDEQFARDLERAKGEAEQGYLSKIIKHTDKQWTAAAWVLERRWPDRWKRRDEQPNIRVEQNQQQAQQLTAGPPQPESDEGLLDYVESLTDIARKAIGERSGAAS